MVAWVDSSCLSDCGKVWGDVGYYHRIQHHPQTIPQSLGQLLSIEAIKFSKWAMEESSLSTDDMDLLVKGIDIRGPD